MLRLVVLALMAVGFSSTGWGSDWAISAGGSGWYLSKTSSTGDRVAVICLPTANHRSSYSFLIRPHNALAQAEAPTLYLDGPRGRSSYRLLPSRSGFWWHAPNQAAFEILIHRLRAMNLEDRLLSPELEIDFAPRNSDQETTMSEFLKVCTGRKG
jgi:hypothetical protein